MTRERPPLLEETPCVLCGPRDYEVVSTRDRRGRPLRTVMCGTCGLVWTNPRPALAAVDRYYATSYRKDYGGRRDPGRRKILRGLIGADERRRVLSGFMPAGARVLDVGCGAGEFVYLLRRRGVNASGIEPGIEFADFSRRVLQVPIDTATVETARVDPASCRLITMFHMLEHVADPVRTLTTVAGWLEPADGRLVVEVPNIESAVVAPRHRFHYAHLFSFTPATLAAVGVAAGLRVERTDVSADGGNVTCVFRPDPAGPRQPAATPDQVDRLRRLFRTHTSARHYLSATPYRRAAGRLVRRWREDRLLGRLRTIQAVLGWAARPAARP